MGLAAVLVRNALRKQVERHGTLFRTVADALERVFDYEETQRRQGLKFDSVTVNEGSSSLEPKNPTKAGKESAATLAAAKCRALQQEVLELRRRVKQEEGRLVCRECKKNRVAVLLQPCSHLHLCAPCARPRDTCPTCSTVIRGTFRPIIG
ncbi:hypothetical protein OTU49_000722 [Cherax quadricarinatus]